MTFNTDRRTGSSWQRRVSFDREETGCDPCCTLTIEVTSSRMVHEGWKRTLPGSKALRSDPWSGRRPLFLRQVNQPTKSIIMRADYRRVFAPWEEGLGQCRTMDQETDTANNINFPMAPRHYYSVLGQLWIRGSDGLILSGFFFPPPPPFSFFTGGEGQIIRWFLRESRQIFWKSLFRSACKSIIGRKSSCVYLGTLYSDPLLFLLWFLVERRTFFERELGRLFKMVCSINGKIIGIFWNE